MRALARLAPRVGVGVGVGVDARETRRCHRRRRLDPVDSTAGRADATRAEDAREAIARRETREGRSSVLSRLGSSAREGWGRRARRRR